MGVKAVQSGDDICGFRRGEVKGRDEKSEIFKWNWKSTE